MKIDIYYFDKLMIFFGTSNSFIQNCLKKNKNFI